MRTIPDGFYRADLQGQVAPGKFDPIDWVGMRGLSLPVAFEVSGQTWRHGAKASVYASLDSQDHRGIHMSRLYTHLQTALLGSKGWSYYGLKSLAEELISTQDGIAKNLKVELEFELSLGRKALVTDASGLRAYPVKIELKIVEGEFQLSVGSQITYSSTCPCSAGLARELNYDAIKDRFVDQDVIEKSEVLSWMKSEGALAGTPHAQRSHADFRLQLSPDFGGDLFSYLDEFLVNFEMALGTPVQTLVKREDEKAFAKANAENLMFCEDAVRRAKSFLMGREEVVGFWCRVSHLESLHAHDAVAEVWGGR